MGHTRIGEKSQMSLRQPPNFTSKKADPGRETAFHRRIHWMGRSGLEAWARPTVSICSSLPPRRAGGRADGSDCPLFLLRPPAQTPGQGFILGHKEEKQGHTQSPCCHLDSSLDLRRGDEQGGLLRGTQGCGAGDSHPATVPFKLLPQLSSCAGPGFPWPGTQCPFPPRWG